MKFVSIALLLVSAGVAGRQLAAQQPPTVDPRRLETGARLYASHCATCHGPSGDAVGDVNLKTGKFKRVSTDLEIMNTVVTGVPGTTMPATPLASGDLVALVAYIRAMKDYGARTVALGSPASGQAIFEGKGGCLTCHRAGRKGSYLGPDLTEVGGAMSAAALEDALLDPKVTAKPGNRVIRAVTKSGAVVTGRHLNEDTWSVQIIDSDGKLRGLWKPDLKSYEVIDSPMPSYKTTLTSEERADLIAYLTSLQPAAAAGRGRGRGRSGQ